ncbi:hypothetical protein PLICRDRAFT_180200 [Plicaturopsis crispa FD-325 SS-3]|uniref:Uncharacterized protein n=1 Tax=Plicaturopsis crispa FD-325 SS-3 TaxID=944288 RepID=A0A0C9T642_PLICR|nr:hypothetical protein PLICRDRAFT_180200 [Plicaturopsis crispa FD-325 SS-3]
MDPYFTDARGHIPRSIIKTADGVRWISLNAGNIAIPEGTYARHKDDTKRLTMSIDSRTGALGEREWAAHMDWWDPVHPWRGFIPVTSSRPNSWFLEFDATAPVERVLAAGNQQTGFRVHHLLAPQIQADVSAITASVREIAAAIHYPPGAHVPDEWRVDSVTDHHRTRWQAALAIAQARRAAVDGIGWLRWIASIYDMNTIALTDAAKMVFPLFDIPNMGLRGVYIDNCRDWRHVNIPHLVKSNVPVVYPWTQSEASDPRFGRLSPEWLQVLDIDELAGGASDVRATGSFAPDPALFPADYPLDHPLCYNTLLERVDWDAPVGTNLGEAAGQKVHTVIVDFEGWRHRDAEYGEVTEATLANYYFIDVPATGIVTRHVFRYRPVTDRKDYDVPAVEDLPWGGPKAILRQREIGRFANAPVNTGVEFDEVSGELIIGHAFRSTQDGLVFEDELAEGLHPTLLGGRLDQEPLTHSARPQAPPRDEGPRATTGEAAATEQPHTSLLARIRSPEPEDDAVSQASYESHSDSSTVYTARMSDGEISEHQDSDNGSTTMASEEPVEAHTAVGLFAQQRRVLETTLSYSEPPADLSLPAHLAWDTRFMDMARLRLPDASVEVRMRCWVLSCDTVITMSEIFSKAIEHCMEFRLEVPLAKATLFRPNPMTQMEIQAGTWYQAGFSELMYDGRLDKLRLRDAYKSTVVSLLERPQGIAFVYAGGILSRLARQFGGEPLLRRAMAGPSAQVSYHHSGRVSEEREITTCDRYSEQEMFLMLGRVPTADRQSVERWLWPPTSILRDHFLFDGEWSARTEIWFQRYLRVFEAGEGRLRTAGEWQQYMRQFSRMRGRLPLTQQSWVRLKEDLDETWPSWNNRSVRDILHGIVDEDI